MWNAEPYQWENAVLRSTCKSKENCQPVCWTLPVIAAERLVSRTLPPRSWFASFLPSLELTGWGMIACIGWNPYTDWTYIFDYWSSSCLLYDFLYSFLFFLSFFFLPLSARLESHYCHHGRRRSHFPLFSSQSLFWALGSCEKLERKLLLAENN